MSHDIWGSRAKGSVSIRELHEKTGELVRRAGASVRPVPVTDRGEVVAVLVGPDAVPSRNGLNECSYLSTSN